MTKVRYTGIRDPDAAFAELQACHDKLKDLRLRVTPMGAGYLRLAEAAEALCRAAAHFTGKPFFYGGAPGGQESDKDWRCHPPRRH